MSAKDRNLEALAALKENWDGYGGKPITAAALNRAKDSLYFVPVASGGLQIELHSADASIEISIDPDGSIQSVSFDRS